MSSKEDKQRQKGSYFLSSFTFVEILVVATIIILLSSVAIVSYTQFNKQARDARRKADIESVRSALEIYRSNNVNSSYPVTLTTLVPNYIQSVPIDPKTTVTPVYIPSPGGCNETATTCSGYSVSSVLESGSKTYKATPYGSQELTPTTIP